MKNILLLPCCVGAFAALSLCHATPFQDLNFDGANTNTIFDGSGGSGYFEGPTTDLLPGWSLSTRFGFEPAVGFDRVVASAANSTIFSPSFDGGRIPVIGLYSFAMFPNSVPDGFVPFSLSQSGDLPADVQSIHFLSYGSPLELRVNGSLLSLTYTPAVSQPGWNPAVPVFDAAGDISSFAGEVVELKFTTLQSPQGDNGLDEIYFSTIGIPEPSTLVLFSLGGLALLVRWNRRREAR